MTCPLVCFKYFLGIGMTPPSLSRNKRTFWNVATLGKSLLYRECVTGCKIVFNCMTRLCNVSFPYFYDEESKIHDKAVLLPWETELLEMSSYRASNQRNIHWLQSVIAVVEGYREETADSCPQGDASGAVETDCETPEQKKSSEEPSVWWAHDEYGRLRRGLSGLSLQPPLLLMSQEQWEVWPRFKSELPDPRARCWLCMKKTPLLSWGSGSPKTSECCPYWWSFKGQRWRERVGKHTRAD